MRRVLCLGVVVLVVLAVAQVAQAASWATQSVPAPQIPSDELWSVSCSGSTGCIAVGQNVNSTGIEATLAERWSGSTWQLQSTLDPAGSEGSALMGVSCPSSADCTAVGNYADSAGIQVTLAERWNGSTWQLQTTPNPAGASVSFLNGVSCTSPAACTAVGVYTTKAGMAVVFAERWNGVSWQLQSVPVPSGASSSRLSGVSCASSTACTAVGSFTDSDGTMVALAERWNGSIWQIQNTPNRTGATGSFLNGVSCPSATACTAVQFSNNKVSTPVTLAERWNGSGWQIETTPNPIGAATSILSGASCTSTAACTAVGYYINSAGTDVPLAARWNATTWQLQGTPNPSGASRSLLSAVSCQSSRACTAVGNYTNSAGTEVTLAERWNGTSWQLQTSPDPAGAKDSSLSGVSCPSSTACTAVGNYTNSAGTRTQAVRGRRR